MAITAMHPTSSERLAAGFIRHVYFDWLRRDLARLAGQKQQRSCNDDENDDEKY